MWMQLSTNLTWQHLYVVTDNAHALTLSMLVTTYVQMLVFPSLSLYVQLYENVFIFMFVC